MGLLEHTGPFQVGAIDLEIPVRTPRSFATDIVSPDRINKPPKKSRKRSAGTPSHGGHSAREHPSTNEGDGGQGESPADEDSLKTWSPFHHGARTSTLHLSTVLFTIFYPTGPSKQELRQHHLPVAWLGRPKRKGVLALVNYLGQYGIAGPFAAIPASPAFATLVAAKMKVYAGASLADPHDERCRAPPPKDRIATGLFGSDPAQFPVLIFSHGLAGNRLAYSQLCGELASQGIIVAAIEHRDGSGIASIVRPPIDPRLSSKNQEAEHTNGAGASKPAKARRHHHPKAAVPYFDFSTVGLRSFPTDPNDDEVGMRQAQLAMRCAEIDECLHVLGRIAAGDGEAVAAEGTRSLTSKLCGRSKSKRGLSGSLAEDPRTLGSWKGKIDMDFPTLMGHSFGGATVMEYLRGDDPAFPYGIILDPWVEPIVIDESRPRHLRAPVYVINSESFTIWDEHFQKLKRLVADAQNSNREHRGWVVTLTGSEHLSFSDFPLLLPRIFRSIVTPSSCIQIYARASLVQIGLLRQRYRERASKPGFKHGDKQAQQREASKDETLGVRGRADAEHEGGHDDACKTVDDEPNDHAGDSDDRGPPISAGAAVELGTIKSRDYSNGQSDEKQISNMTAVASSGGANVERQTLIHSEPSHIGESAPAAPLTSDSKREPRSPGGQSSVNARESSTSTGSDDFPRADEGLYHQQLKETEDPLFKGEDKEKHMGILAQAKERAADRLWSRKKEQKHESKASTGSHPCERRSEDTATTSCSGPHPPPRGVVAFRTPSGGMTSKPRSSADSVDFTLDPSTIPESDRREIDTDVEIVHAALEDLSAGQRHKKPKLKSLMSVLYLSYGMRSGLGPPGSILVHDLRKRGAGAEGRGGEEQGQQEEENQRCATQGAESGRRRPRNRVKRGSFIVNT
ncbi:unnamed protein product [Parajaminaea phylloscopi]